MTPDDRSERHCSETTTIQNRLDNSAKTRRIVSEPARISRLHATFEKRLRHLLHSVSRIFAWRHHDVQLSPWRNISMPFGSAFSMPLCAQSGFAAPRSGIGLNRNKTTFDQSLVAEHSIDVDRCVLGVFNIV